VAQQKAIQSFRLWLHSGLRQSGSVLRTAVVSWGVAQAGLCRAVGAGVLRGRRGVSRLWLAGWVVGKNAIQSFPGALSQAVICRAVGAGVLHGGREALRDACAGRRGILRGCCADGEGSRAPEELAVARKSGGGWGRWVLEACLVNLHHAFVGFVLAFDEGLLVDV
jgi:hypothetical protein